MDFEKTHIAEAIEEAYGKNRIVIHSSQVPISIMKYCLKHYAKVIAILKGGNHVLVQNIITHQQAILYIKPDNSISNILFGMQYPPLWEKVNPGNPLS